MDDRRCFRDSCVGVIIVFRPYLSALDLTPLHHYRGYLRGEAATVQTANATRFPVLPEDYLGSTPAHMVLHGY